MGEHGIPDSYINMSGERSPYTKAVPKGGAKGPADTGVQGGPRAQSVVGTETNGPLSAPQTTLYGKNAAEATDKPRNVRLVRSAIGNRDFWDARATAGGTEGA